MKEIYDWVPWFQELASRIKEGGPQVLAERAKEVDWRNDNPSLLKHGDENIDPFSFFYYLAALNHLHNWNTVYRSVAEVFGLRTPIDYAPSEVPIFPAPPALAALFHYKGRGKPQLLWELFEQALSDSVRSETFERALEIPNVGVRSLTQTLFLIEPTRFLPFDDKSVLSLGICEDNKPPTKITWNKYRQEMENIGRAFPACEFYEIQMFAYLWSTDLKPKDPRRWYQVGTNVYNDETDYWEDSKDNFKENNWVYTGGPGGGIPWPDQGVSTDKAKYPLEDPVSGDIVLVRYGTKQGRGIGIVYRNDYKDELSDKSRLHVLWLNKKSAQLAGWTTRLGFWDARDATKMAFLSTGAYTPTFDLLKRLPPGFGPVPPPPKPVMHPRNQILYGPPGTGKTYDAVTRAMAIVLGVDVDRIGEEDRAQFRAFRFDPAEGTGQVAMVTFHQSFSYEEFVEGIRPRLDAGNELGYERRNGIFKRIANVANEAREAQHEPDQKYVLIIDEINRGNIPKIFGELITLIEESRRLGESDETRVVLPYSNKEFGVPNNLYIIGTMNTADRSIVLVDTALRRRFDFVEMMPEPEHEHISADVEGVQLRKMLKAMNERISLLLDRERQIGHTYLFKVTDMETLSHRFRNAILPLLQEYFYDDWSKIREVLGSSGFVVKQKLGYTAGLRTSDLVDKDRFVYERLPDDDSKWLDPGEYRKIYSDDTSSESS